MKSFRSGRFIISAPISNAEPNLSCSCWAGLVLVHSTAFLIPTACLWTLSNSLAASVTLLLVLIDEQYWFWKHKLLRLSRFCYSKPITRLRRGCKHQNFVPLGPSLVQWLLIIVLLEKRIVHFVILTCSPMGVATHIYLEQGSCQLPSICRSCGVEHPNEWIIASAGCILSLYLKEADRCKTALIEFIFEFSPFLGPLFHVCKQCWV